MSDSILVHFQDLYSPSLRHQTSMIQEQVDSGLYVIKRFAYFLQKLMLVRKPAVLEMIKLTEHEKDKVERAKSDRMSNHLDAYLKTQDAYSTMLNDELKFVQAVLESVADPLLKWHKEAEKTRDAIVKKEAALHKSYRDTLAKINSTRDTAIKAWSNLQSTRKDVLKAQQGVRDGKNNANKDLKNAETKLKKDKVKVEAEFRKLEIMVEHGNSFQDNYWSHDLPKIVEEWEKLEVDRLHRFGAHFALYTRLQTQAVTPVQTASSIFEEAFQHLNGSAEMREFVSSSVRLSGLPSAPALIAPRLPCNSVDLASTSPSAESRINEVLDMDLPEAIQANSSEVDDRSSMKGPSFNSANNAIAPGSMSSNSSSIPRQTLIEEQRMTLGSMNSPPPSDYRSMSVVAPTTPPASSAAAYEQDTIDSTSSVSPASASSTSAPAVPSIPLYNGKQPIKFFRALYDFDPTDEEDLPFSEGDIIALLQIPDGGLNFALDTGAWWNGAVLLPNGTYGRTGSFPSNYVADHNM